MKLDKKEDDWKKLKVSPEKEEDEEEEDGGIATMFSKFIKRKLDTSKRKFAEVE